CCTSVSRDVVSLQALKSFLASPDQTRLGACGVVATRRGHAVEARPLQQEAWPRRNARTCLSQHCIGRGISGREKPPPNRINLILMKSPDNPEYRSQIQRLAHFIGELLPAQSLQLLFPFGSFLLFLGASHTWYLLRLPQEFEAVLRQQNYQIDPNAYQRF